MMNQSGTMRYVVIIAVLALTPGPLKSQTWHGYSVRVDAPDCRLAARSSDNFIGDGHFGTVHARRWQLQAISVSTAVAASYAVHKIFHRSAPTSALLGGVGVGILPHVRSQLFQRRYPISLTDDAADLAERMVPFLVVEEHREHSFTAHMASALGIVGTLLGASCFASP